MYLVYWNQAAAVYLSLYYSSFFFLSNFQTLKFFITLSSGTVRPRRLKLGTHVDNGQMYRIYWNQAAAAYSSLYFYSLLSSDFQTLKIFVALFLETEAYKVDTWYSCGQWVDVSCVPQSGCCFLFVPFFFVTNFQKFKFSSHFPRNSEAKTV